MVVGGCRSFLLLVTTHADRYSIARYIHQLNRRDIGPTARATEIIEPTILANSRYENDLSRIA